MKFLEEISKIISDYAKHGDNRSVEALLKIQDRLAGYSYLLAEYAAQLKYTYNENYFIRKIEFQKSKHAYINTGKSATAAENLAEIEVQEWRKKEIESESHGYKADLLLKQVNRVLGALQQRISYMKIDIEK